MKKGKRLQVVLLAIILLGIVWLTVVLSPSNRKRQEDLMAEAQAYMDDKIYIYAVECLQKACSYQTDLTEMAEERLKEACLPLLSQLDYATIYEDILIAQMERDSADATIFREGAEYYFAMNDEEEALNWLRIGVEKTADTALIQYYEDNRYGYDLSWDEYEDCGMIINQSIPVKLDGKWGLAKYNGTLLVPCEYEMVTNYSQDRLIAQNDGETFAINLDNNRMSLLHDFAKQIGNYEGNRLAILLDDGWHRANGELKVGTETYQTLGAYHDGFAAACIDGKWGLIDSAGEWKLEPQFEEILCNEAGQAYFQNCVFAKQGDQILLVRDGETLGNPYEDAEPFSETGYAAVCREGKWGFVDANGEIRIPFQYDEAHSFGQHLAGVREGDKWGFISLQGDMVIEPTFEEVKAFSSGCAPVKTEYGWKFIQLHEYRQEEGL